MFEWLKRLVARRELAELDELRREMLMLDFGRSVDRHQDWIKKFAAESRAANHGGRIDEAREKMRGTRAASVGREAHNHFVVPLRVPLEYLDQNWIKKFADDWRDSCHESRGRTLFSETCRWEYHAPAPLPKRDAAMRAQCELCERGIDYRFLGMTGEEES
ncbi:TPA: hypothetical protein ACT5B2_003825 [Burkholderia cenocepacia]|uniref:hypothetical protein n=1 Tax=Burkholderia cenocepacia TaxID=95486 RepID=UPI002AB771A1|nr:hypothetical protein [Burkholderia cenocepacia]